MDEGLFLLQTAWAPNGVKVDFDACDIQLGSGEAACVEIKDGECTFSKVCKDLVYPDAAVSTWNGLGFMTCVVTLLTALFLAN